MKYKIVKGKYIVEGDDSESYRVDDLDSLKLKDGIDSNTRNDISNAIRRLKSFLAHRRDLQYAMQCLKNMRFESDSTLIDEALINYAIVLFNRCFDSKGADTDHRAQLNKKSTYRNPELREEYDYFRNLRNEYIAHEGSDFAKYKIGMTINNTDEKSFEICSIVYRSKMANQRNCQRLENLLFETGKYVDSQVVVLQEKIVKAYNNGLFEESTVKPLQVDEKMISYLW